MGEELLNVFIRRLEYEAMLIIIVIFNERLLDRFLLWVKLINAGVFHPHSNIKAKSSR